MRRSERRSRRKALPPLLGALGLTLAVFAILLVVVAANAAHGIWIEGQHDPKFGGEWGNLWMIVVIHSWLLSIPCGILLLGNAISAFLSRRKWSISLVVISALFTLLAGRWIIAESAPDGWILFEVPAGCALAAIVWTLLSEVARGHVGDYQGPREKPLM